MRVSKKKSASIVLYNARLVVCPFVVNVRLPVGEPGSKVVLHLEMNRQRRAAGEALDGEPAAARIGYLDAVAL